VIRVSLQTRSFLIFLLTPTVILLADNFMNVKVL